MIILLQNLKENFLMKFVKVICANFIFSKEFKIGNWQPHLHPRICYILSRSRAKRPLISNFLQNICGIPYNLHVDQKLFSFEIKSIFDAQFRLVQFL